MAKFDDILATIGRTPVVQKLLKASGVTYDESADVDPHSFLPAWLHKR